MSYLDSWTDEESAARPLPVEESPDESLGGPDIRMAFEASTGLDGAGVGRGRALSSSLGIPEGFVLENPYKAETERKARTVEQHPTLAAWAAEDKTNAALVREDADGLSALWDAVSTTWNTETQALGSAWDKGKMQVEYSALGEQYRAGDDTALPKIQDLRQRMSEAEKSGAGTLADSVGLATAAGQIPLQLNMLVPSATEAFGMGTAVWGASTLATAGTGAALGSVVPGAGTIAGGIGGAAAGQIPAVGAGFTAAKATYLVRQAQRSFSMERGAFIADLAQEQDANGENLPREVQNVSADVYGFLAAAVETGGEALFLRLLKPLGGDALVEQVGQQGIKGMLRSAVKRAAFDQSVRGALLDMGARVGINSLGEGLEESVQEVASILVEAGAKQYTAAVNDTAFLDTTIFTPENAARVGSSFTGGMAAGAWLGGGPIMLSGALDAHGAKQAQDFAQKHVALHTKVEESQTKTLSPTHMQDALEAASPALRENVHLPADAVLELFQNGTDLLTPLGLDETAVASAASMGHALVVPVSRLHASLDHSQFSAAARIMRRSPDTFSALDAEGTEEKTEADALRVTELFQQQAEEMADMDAERERVRAEAVSAVHSVPGLKAQAEALAGGTESYVDQWLMLLDGFARRMTPQGDNAADIFRRLAVAGLEGQRRSVQNAEEAIGQDLDALPTVAGIAEHRRVRGADTALVGNAEADAARYEVWEAADLVPSHDPENSFAKRVGYPDGVQERPYHSDAGEQDKVRRNAAALDWRYLVNTNPDAVNGPPIVSEKGVVLGGNSRTMFLQLAYGGNQERASAYREAIAAQAGMYGLSPERLQDFERPVLVRVVRGEMDAQSMAVKSRLYNQSQTQGLQAQAEGVSKARLISAESMAILGRAMTEHDSLRGFLDATASREFVDALARDGVLEQTQLARLTTEGGRLNDAGKSLVENALRGSIVADYDVLRATPPSVLHKLDRAVPSLARLRARGEGWDMSGAVTEALRQVGQASAQGKDIDVFLGQGALLQSDTARDRPAVQALALTFANATQKEVQLRFALLAQAAEGQAKGQASLVSMPENSVPQSFVRAFMQPVAQVGGEPVAGFAPQSNPQHAALQYAFEHSGKGHSVAEAVARLQKIVGDKKARPDVKAEARERMRLLAPMDGAVAVYPPKLGNFFSYRQGQELFHALNPGVDLDKALPVVHAQRESAPLWQSMKGGKREIVLSIAGKLYNESTGLDMTLSAKNVEHLISSATSRGMGGEAHMAAVRNVRELMRVAELIDTYPDRKQQEDVKNIHRFFAPLGYDGSVYAVNMTVKEYSGERYIEMDGVHKLYDLKLENKTPAGLADKLPESGTVVRPAGVLEEAPTGLADGQLSKKSGVRPASASRITIRQLLEGVKDSEGNAYFHAEDNTASARGSIAPFSEGHLISLFKNANLSTLLHETGHAFMLEMESAVHSGMADESMAADFQTLRQWVGAGDGLPLTSEQHEQLARGFEAYLMEGRAPSQALESAFARFRRWMKTIYRVAKNLRVELSDEVRGVFDRMLAVEKEVAAASARNELLDLTVSELDALGLTGPERTYAAGLMAAARSAAAERLQLVRDRERTKRLGQYRLEAKEELAQEQVYTAKSAMRATPLDFDAVREDFGGGLARDVMRKVPGGLKSGGVDPEIFAAEHGYENGVALLRDIAASKSMKDAVEERAQTKDAEHDAAFAAEEYLLDTQEATEQVGMVGQYLARHQGAEHVAQEAFARVAERELLSMPMGRAVRSSDFVAAMRRALRDERQAIGRGDFAAALTANHKARLNLEFSRRSRDVQRRREDVEKQIKHFVHMAKGDADARFMVMDIAMRHGLGKYRAGLAEGRDPSTLRDWIASAESDGYGIFVDDTVLYGPGKPWREMRTADFESLSETVTQIVTVERNRRKLLTARGKEELDAVVEDVATSILNNHAQRTLKTVERDPAIQRLAGNIHAVHTKVEALCLSLDGGEMGPAWEYIYRPITEAEDSQTLRFKDAREALRGPALFGAYARGELAKLARHKTLVPEVGEKLTYENRIALALNMGNEINRARIREGHDWDDAQIAAVLRPLTRRDWQFVQAVWDYLETFKEESFALQEDISGLRPTAVEAKPLSVTTADGHVLELRGGYYPIKYNSESGFRAYQQEQAALDKELFGGRNYGAAMTRHGHLKERAKVGLQTPLLLDLSVVTDHVFNTIHDLSYRRAVLDVAKVIRHSRLREVMESTVGRELYRELMPWLQGVSNERQDPMHYVHRWVRWARSATSIMQMGYKVTTMVVQPLGFTQTVEVLGYRYAGAGLKTVYANPTRLPALIEETFARSPMMSGRIRSFDRDVRDMTKQLYSRGGMFGWVDAVRDNAFVPMGVFQMGVDLPTWWGAYEKGLKDYAGDEKQAALYADSVVRMAQGSGATKDLARVQRGDDLLRMTTMFYSYFNTFYNLAARRFGELKRDRSPAAIFRAANTALLIWFIPAVLAELMAGRGPDDDEDAWKWASKNILQYPFQAVVGVRDMANGAFGEFGYQITPAQSAPKSLVMWVKSVNKALEEEDAGKLIKPTAEAVGYLFGLPMKQPITTVGNVWDYMTGYDPEFEVRDLFFVKPKSRR